MPACILPSRIKEFRKALKNRTLDLNKIFDATTTTEQRISIFKEFAGDSAAEVVKLFEEKLILKHKALGLKNAINKLGEMGRYDPAKKASLDQAMSEWKHAQQERVLSPLEEQTFLNSLADKILGTEVSKAEAKTAFEFSTKAEEAFKGYDKTTETWSSPKAEAEYGASKVVYKNYVDALKTGDLGVLENLKGWNQELKDLWKEDPHAAIAKAAGDSVGTVSNMMVNAVASWDNSFMGRQGAITLIKSPKTWWNMATKSMGDFYKTLKGEKPQDVLMAQVYSHPDFINGNFQKAKITFGVEEAVPTKILESTPVIGKVFEASDVAFMNSAARAKMGLFEIQKQVYEAKGIPLDDAILRDMGTTVNAIAARGKLGKIGEGKIVKTLLWAPRMLKADWDILTGHTLGFGLETKTARVQAAKTTFQVVVATAAISAIAEGMGAEIEKDPRSADFLKIKIGDTRINTPFARGIPQIVTLLSRLVSQSSKSTSTGIIRKLNTGEFGSQSLFDVGMDFLVNKTTPPVGIALSVLRGRDFKGDKPTTKGVAFGSLPISMQNFIELDEKSKTPAVWGAFLDLVGVSANTYSSTENDWEQSTGKELAQFKEIVGEADFKKANDSYNEQFSLWMNETKNQAEFKSLSEDDKAKMVTKKKNEIKKTIFNSYGFKYKQNK